MSKVVSMVIRARIPRRRVGLAIIEITFLNKFLKMFIEPSINLLIVNDNDF